MSKLVEGKPITERRIQDALYYDMFSSYLLMCPNYTPSGWWECDMFAVTKAGYMVEHEIKVTLADFKKDADKSRRVFDWDTYNQVRGNWPADKPFTDLDIIHNKHEKLVARDTCGPSRFFYVVPENMVTVADCPEWAGLKYARNRGRLSDHLWLTTIKDAPKLHGQKVSDKVLNHCRSVFYHRFWKLRTKASDADLMAVDNALSVENEAVRRQEACGE